MGNKPSNSPAHAYEPEPYPILKAWPEFWSMSEEEKTKTLEARARQNGGKGYLPSKSLEQEIER
jgi:hypothetical protein